MELQFERSANAAPKKCPLQIIRSANQPLLGLAKSPSMMVTSSVNGAAAGQRSVTGANSQFVQRSLSVNEANVIFESTSSSNSDTDNEKDNKDKLNAANKSATTSPSHGVSGARVVIPKSDDAETFGNFFAPKKEKISTPEEEGINIEDFDHVKSTHR